MAIIQICGIIGWDSTPQGLRDALAEANGADVEIEVSSPGGYIAPGLEMFNLLRNYPGKTRARLTGYAMSMGSYIPLACDEIVAEDNAVFMIHNAQGGAFGDHNDILGYGAYLKGLSGIICRAYAKKTGKTCDELAAMMDAETYFFGSEMVDAGFVDSIIETDVDEDKDTALAMARASFDDAFARISSEPVQAREDMQRAAAILGEVMKVGTYSDTIKLKDETWSKSESETRWRAHANVEGTDDLPDSVYSKRFAYVSDNASFGGHHFPIMDYKDGEFVNVAAVRNGLARLPQSNSVPASDKPKVKALLQKYLNRFNEDENFNPAAAGQTPKEVQQMAVLQKLLADNPAAKALYEANLATAKAEGERAVVARIEKVAPFLTSKEYPPSIATTALAVLKGEEPIGTLSASVAAVDAVREQFQQSAAVREGQNLPDTPGGQQPAHEPGAIIDSEESLAAEIARFNGQGGK